MQKYLSPTGNDTTGNGTYASPYLTYAKCIAMTSAGDTITFKNGTYSVTHFPMGTNIGNRIVNAETVGQVTIDFGSNVYNANIGAIVVDTASFVDGICFNGGIAQSTLTNFMYVNDTKNITFTRCIFSNQSLGGDNAGLGRGSFCSPAYHVAGAGTMTITFIGCIFKGYFFPASSADPLFIHYHGGMTYLTLTVINCVFYPKTTGVRPPIFYLPAPGIAIFKNNIFLNTGTPLAIGSGDSVTFSNNCTFTGWTTIPTGTGNITTDPLFVDAPNSNFNLRPTSPCIGAGVLV